jgi:hypothetical protein
MSHFLYGQEGGTFLFSMPGLFQKTWDKPLMFRIETS